LQGNAEGPMGINRRCFLAATGGIALGGLLNGCQRAAGTDLRLAMLTNALPPQLIQSFQRDQGGDVAVNPQNSLRSLFSLLQRWHNQPDQPGLSPPADWVSLPDYWLAPAIRQRLVQPVAVAELSHWPELPTVWPDLVRRDRDGLPSLEGSPWAVPYRWSHLVIIYNPDRLPPGVAPLTSWADLLRPELTRRVLLPDHPRLVLGLAQQAVGASANGPDPAAVADLPNFLDQLHQQVRAYDSNHYLEALIIGDATAVVGWSDEALPLLRQYRHLAAAVPAAGTLLSTQLWVQPAGLADPAPLADPWLDFCLGPDFATQLAIFGQGTAPRLWGVPSEQLPEALGRSPQLVLPPVVADQSEFLLPLTAAAEARYLDLWKALRS
jgi:putative spermidine/putrescine transport system substrate-binding protein